MSNPSFNGPVATSNGPWELLHALLQTLNSTDEFTWSAGSYRAHFLGSAWETELVFVSTTGVKVKLRGTQSVDEAAARLRRAEHSQENGPWFGIDVEMHSDGAQIVTRTYGKLPEWQQPIPDSAYAEELRLFPRNDAAVPGWLRAKLGPMAGGQAPGPGPGFAPPTPPVAPPFGAVPQRSAAPHFGGVPQQPSAPQFGAIPQQPPAVPPFGPAPQQPAPPPQFGGPPQQPAPPQFGAAPGPAAGWPPPAQTPPPPPMPPAPTPPPPPMAAAPPAMPAAAPPGGLRHAKPFDGTDQATGMPIINRDRIPGDEVQRVLAYLNAGPVFLFASTYAKDAFYPNNPPSVPMKFATDGTWIWSGGIVYYLEKYGLPPEPDFLAHIRAHNYVLAPVSDQAKEAARRLMTQNMQQLS